MMKVEIKVTKEVEIKSVLIKAQPRYWEDSTVNGEDDTDGKIPCREGELWCPKIDIETGIIINWQKGVHAGIHYKVCDAGSYFLLDENNQIVLSIKNDYVPDLIPGAWGDYIIMTIDKEGKILEWKNNIDVSDFQTVEEEDD